MKTKITINATYIRPFFRILAGLDVLLLSIGLLGGFDEAVMRLESYGFPLATLVVSLMLAAGFTSGSSLIIGSRVRAAVWPIMFLVLPQLGIMDALHTGNEWGDLQWLYQVLRMLEVPSLLAILFWLFLEGAGNWSLDAWRERRSRHLSHGF